jgi:hypothetical protein
MKELLLTIAGFGTLAVVCLFAVALSTLARPLAALLEAWTGLLKATTEKMFTDFRAPVQREKAVIHKPLMPAPRITPTPPCFCCECGTAVYRDPIEAFELPGAAYLTFECAECGERTLKPNRLPDKVANNAPGSA